MERLQELISQLREQYEQQADPSKMLLTLRFLEAELTGMLYQPSPNRGTANVAVMMPSSKVTPPHETGARSRDTHAPALKEVAFSNGTTSLPIETAAPAPSGPAPAAPSAPQKPGAGQELKPSFAPEIRTASYGDVQAPIRSIPVPAVNGHGQPGWAYDPLTDIPTLNQQTTSRELNDVIGNNGTSLNDQLKADVLELAAALNDTPVRDLKKAIGINDRFVFINLLFRGDEVMYERSIKTINSFRILPEAEYWIERELKVKLAWDETREVTRHFYQLVKRRFS